MKRIRFDDYFSEMTDTFMFCACGVPCAFFAGMIIYGITWRILRAAGKSYPDHLFWWIMLGFGALFVIFILVMFFCCFYNFLKAIILDASARRQCKAKGHDWDELLHCRRCGEVKPHEHMWGGCRCMLCGEQRDEGHAWITEVCPTCGGSGHVTRYDDWGNDYEEPCGCAHPVERVCIVCGKREDDSV